MTAPPLLEVRNLRVVYPGDDGDFRAVRNVSFSLGRERLGIVGESGSGKSTTGRAIMGLIPRPGRVEADAMRLGDADLTRLNERGFRRLRGKRIAMVMQDPKFSLDPVMTVGKQVAETHRYHFRSSWKAARTAALEMLEAVHIRDPERVYAQYPHQISGGMGQRVMIAMMLIAGPEILIADEPTSALDVSVQQQVLAIMDEMVRSRGMGLILISHNLRLVSSFCDRVLVMYAGQIVESCRANRLHAATHPYTRGLLTALPELGNRRAELPQLRRDPEWLADLPAQVGTAP
ncbi:MAG: ABC transporter ATP-binding protein [Proteobacteria bacterium]|nr:ABC transporter ATP-binding protein [Pseudomonadota bacterium]